MKIHCLRAIFISFLVISLVLSGDEIGDKEKISERYNTAIGISFGNYFPFRDTIFPYPKCDYYVLLPYYISRKGANITFTFQKRISLSFSVDYGKASGLDYSGIMPAFYSLPQFAIFHISIISSYETHIYKGFYLAFGGNCSIFTHTLNLMGMNGNASSINILIQGGLKLNIGQSWYISVTQEYYLFPLIKGFIGQREYNMFPGPTINLGYKFRVKRSRQ